MSCPLLETQGPHLGTNSLTTRHTPSSNQCIVAGTLTLTRGEREEIYFMLSLDHKLSDLASILLYIESLRALSNQS